VHGPVFPSQCNFPTICSAEIISPHTKAGSGVMHLGGGRIGSLGHFASLPPVVAALVPGPTTPVQDWTIRNPPLKSLRHWGRHEMSGPNRGATRCALPGFGRRLRRRERAATGSFPVGLCVWGAGSLCAGCDLGFSVRPGLGQPPSPRSSVTRYRPLDRRNPGFVPGRFGPGPARLLELQEAGEFRAGRRKCGSAGPL